MIFFITLSYQLWMAKKAKRGQKGAKKRAKKGQKGQKGQKIQNRTGNFKKANTFQFISWWW